MVDEPAAIDVAAQDSVDKFTVAGGRTVKLLVFTLAPSVAVTTAAVWVPTVPALATKDPVVLPPVICRVAGTARDALLLLRVTAAPALGAAALRLTVQTAFAPAATLAGLQASELIVGAGGWTVTIAVRDAPFKAAVTVAFVACVTEAAVAWKVAELAPAETVTLAGMDSAALLLLRVMLAPPVPALVESEMLQATTAPAETVVGVQLRLLTLGTVAATRFTRPPADKTDKLAPVAEAALGEETWMLRVVAILPAATVAFTTATGPAAIVLLLAAQIRQVMLPLDGWQLLALPALMLLCPRLTFTALNSAGL